MQREFEAFAYNTAQKEAAELFRRAITRLGDRVNDDGRLDLTRESAVVVKGLCAPEPEEEGPRTGAWPSRTVGGTAASTPSSASTPAPRRGAPRPWTRADAARGAKASTGAHGRVGVRPGTTTGGRQRPEMSRRSGSTPLPASSGGQRRTRTSARTATAGAGKTSTRGGVREGQSPRGGRSCGRAAASSKTPGREMPRWR